MPAFEAEDFWEDLLVFIEQRRVIPVVGPELLSIEVDGQRLPLYRAVAARLLLRYGLETLPSNNDGLYEAVCALSASGRRVRDLYRPIHDIIQTVVAEHPEALLPLRDLAAIRHFDLFVTTTPDDLLTRALNAVRFDGTPQTHELEYAPKLPTTRHRDIPEAPTSGYTGVFYFLGKADVSPFFSIHEEDALEFAYTLQRGNGPERMLSEMRTRNLLLIGCAFGDWLNRLFLRLSNTDRLSSDQRTKKEYLVGQEAGWNRDFVVFLERFSQDSRRYPIDAATFVSELLRRWRDRNPPLSATLYAPPVAPSTGAGTIFISYAHEDIGAARALFDQFQVVSGDVAWFDKSDLTAGDKWDAQIRGAIQKCGLFLPLLSAQTEQRPEGFFRSEWLDAVKRSERIQGRKFIFPVVIDPAYEDDPGLYRLVPSHFQAIQYSHAPNGKMSETLTKLFQEQIRELRRG